MTGFANWVTFVGVLLVVGAAGARLVAGPRGTLVAEGRLGLVGALLLLLGAALRLAAQVQGFVDPGDPVTHAAVRAVLHSNWAVGWYWQAGTAVAAVALSLGGTWPVWLGAVLVCVALPVTGHAREAPQGEAAGIAAGALHLLAGGLWLGTLAVLFLRRQALFGGVEGPGALRDAILRFSPLALGAAVVVGLSGALSSWWLVGTWAALRQSDYGRQLLLKLGFLGLLLGIAFVNWRVMRPSLGTPQASSRLWRAVAVELLLALAVLAVSATLVATEAPGLE